MIPYKVVVQNKEIKKNKFERKRYLAKSILFKVNKIKYKDNEKINNNNFFILAFIMNGEKK